MGRNKLFFFKLGIFLVLALILNAGMNVIYDHWMYYFRLARNQDEQLNACPDTLKYLMLGNSHNRIDPSFLGNGFCYITPKESYTETYFKLRYLLKNSGKKPRNILLSIDPVNFSPKAEYELSFEGYWKKYLDYRELAKEYNDNSYLLNRVGANYFSYLGNYKYVYLSLFFRWADLQKVRKGYIPARDYKNFAREPNRDALGYETAFAYLASYAKNSTIGESKYYLKILDLCRDYGIHLVLLRMPVTDEYLSYARKLVDLDTLDRQILDLTRLHCTDFKVFDFRNEFRGKPQYFFNADHVNPVGAMIVSTKIRSALENSSGAQIPERLRFK